MNYESIILQVIEISRQVGQYLKSEQVKIESGIVEKKGQHDFVTYVDKTAEKQIVEQLQKLLPDAGFIAEENSVQREDKPLMWIIDPLDGTTNYIHGMSPFAISIGLMENNELVGGVVYEVGLEECFYAWKSSPAYLNGKEIKTSNTELLSESLIATGFPYYDYGRLEKFMKSLAYFVQNTHGIRRLGTAATDLVYVACGRIEAFYEYGLSPWDVAAGAFIVQQAGGRISDYKGGGNYLFGKEIIASNEKIYTDFQAKVEEYMSN
ncbi:MAG: inositol monophosphatase [Bacteroidales bacterium]|nr:inositol monophosphatase [Bacteroidales bacterium]